MSDFFFYDKNTYSYKKETKDFQYWLRKALSYLPLIFLFMFITIYGFIWLYQGDAENKVQNENRKLLEHIGKNEEILVSLKIELDSIKEQNKRLHKMILNTEPEEDSIDRDAEEIALKGNQSLENIEQEINNLKSKIREQKDEQTLLYELGTVKKSELKAKPAIRPIRTGIISGFGKRKHPLHKVDRNHIGIDFKADMGSDVFATGDGYVMEVGNKSTGQGTYIVINHGFGYVSKYFHLSKVKVRSYQQVKRGQLIAESGNSGLTKGPHLHYEIWHNNVAVDPIDYFFSDLNPNDYAKFKKQNGVYNESMD